MGFRRGQAATYKVDAHDELCLGAAIAWRLSHAASWPLVGLRATMAARWRGAAVSSWLAVAAAWRALGRIARRAALGRVAHGLLLLRRVAGGACVDGRQRAGGAAVLLLRGAEAARRSVCV